MGKLNTYSPRDTASYVAWKINERIDLILDTLSTEYTQFKHLRTPLEYFTVCSMTMIMITGPHIFSVAFMNCKNWVFRARSKLFDAILQLIYLNICLEVNSLAIH